MPGLYKISTSTNNASPSEKKSKQKKNIYIYFGRGTKNSLPDLTNERDEYFSKKIKGKEILQKYAIPKGNKFDKKPKQYKRLTKIGTCP